MRDVLTGFSTIWVVIGAGWLVAHLRILDEQAQRALSRTSFFVGSPALLFLVLRDADVHRVFGHNVLVTLAATLAAIVSYLPLARVFLRGLDRTSLVLGSTSAGYVNSANLGIPIAAFVLKDVTWVAPVLLLQVALIQPIALTILDADRAREAGTPLSLWRNISLPFRNPMTVGVLLGLAANLAHLRIPLPVRAPVQMLGNLSVPCMLLAFGMSLRFGPLPGRNSSTPAATLAILVKLFLHPLIAFGLARLAGLDHDTTLAVVVLAGLPTAQNVFLWAARHGRGVVLARDTIFVTTISSLATITAIAALLG